MNNRFKTIPLASVRPKQPTAKDYKAITDKMNYLAHAYLSFHDQDIMRGNFIADFVKGRQIEQFAPRVQQGIRLHRAIDTFTDEHPLTKEAKQLFKPAVGLYSGVFTDIIFDHYLANDPLHFSDKQLYDFSQEAYQVLNTDFEHLPSVFKQVLQYMQRDNWLYSYKNREGIFQSMRGVSRRAKYLETPAEVTFQVFEDHYQTLAKIYEAFFPKLEEYVKGYIAEHLGGVMPG
ncbi:acyl carrier protein phosphodiesterase [Chitinophaga skermanii]|uniref:acyl carrier protein phosphodiesterase n=1 Tax=Chitinophaga skermanii TaxID=331697 RepID=UPI001314C9F1|nr:ACP phosphodiesterase [Chitinophaga skermanii]